MQASERASKGNEEQERVKFSLYTFLCTQGRGRKRVCSR